MALFPKLINFILAHTRLFFWLSFTGTNFALFSPSIGERGEIYNLDIIIHYALFLVFAGSAFLYFKRIEAVLFAIALFIPASEFIQEFFIHGRGYEFTDILSGFAGMLSGFLTARKMRKIDVS
jgi:hypothetical protein